jgi:hypothetical protein
LSKVGYLLLVLVASTQVTQAQTETNRPSRKTSGDYQFTTATPVAVPTLVLPQQTSVSVPTVTLPRPTATPRPDAHHTPKHKRRIQAKRHAVPPKRWILAYLTSYCPGSAGWLSASGQTVFYGMLANDFYPFGTHVYMPVIGITGVVLDRVGAYPSWNHFDVWSPVCDGTPTGWFHVAVLAG